MKFLFATNCCSGSLVSFSEAQIIAAASLPSEPSFPKIIPYTIVGMIAACVLTMVLIMAAALLSTVAASHSVSRRQVAEPPRPIARDEVEPVFAVESEQPEFTTLVSRDETVPENEEVSFSESPSLDMGEELQPIVEETVDLMQQSSVT